jgi:hypothetical protein
LFEGGTKLYIYIYIYISKRYIIAYAAPAVTLAALASAALINGENLFDGLPAERLAPWQ